MRSHPLVRSTVITVLLLLCGACPLSAETAQEYYEKGNKQLQAGKYQDAIAAYNQALALDPDGIGAYINRAVAKWNLKDDAAALADLALAIRLEPEAVDAYRMRAHIRALANDPVRAIEDLDAGLKLVPDDAEMLAMRAQSEVAMEEYDAALRDVNRGLELKPDFPAALRLRAGLHERRNDTPAALRDLDRAIALVPAFLDALDERADLKFRLLDFAGAIADARKVLAIDPSLGSPARLQGYALFGSADYAGAAKALAAAADSDPANASFPLLVRHFALLRAGAADDRLATSWGKWTDRAWSQALAKFVCGQLTEDQLEEWVAKGRDDMERLGRQCEAHFYVGLVRLKAGDRSTARLRFQGARDTKAATYIEHTLAIAELKRL